MGNTLQGLAAGVKTTSTLKSIAPAVVEQTETEIIATPVSVNQINGNSINRNTPDFFEATFINGDAVATKLPFYSLIAKPGDAAIFNVTGFAVDNVLISTSDYGALPLGVNVSKLQGFLTQIASTQVIVSKIEVQAATNAQAITKLIVGYFDWNQELVQSSKITSLCDECANNFNPNVFNRLFTGPFAIGKNQGFTYSLAAGATILWRMYIMGEDVVGNYTQVGA